MTLWLDTITSNFSNYLCYIDRLEMCLSGQHDNYTCSLHTITFIFSNFYRCLHVGVIVLFSVRVYVNK